MARTQPPTIDMTTDEVTHILCPICHKQNLRRARFCQHCGRDVTLNNDGPRYYITRVIKEGGQGAVYETIGEDGKVYAVKEMLDRFVDPKERSEAIARFEAEAELLERLKHPRIPRVHAHFKDEGRHYLAMDFIRGDDLEELLKRQGALPEQQVLEWADQICDVLHYLHQYGLIYRDMKPSNIMIDRQDGAIKLVDFGITKVFQPTERGTQIGTPGYAPPEQYQGLATRESDIYSLGATMHHMLTGRDPRDEPPFSFPPPHSLNPNISQRTSDAIMRALKMKPEERYRSVPEFRAMLRPLAAPTRQIRRAPATQPIPAPARPPANAPTATAARPAASATPPAPQPIAQQPATPGRAGSFFAPVRSFFLWLLRTVLILLVIVILAGATLVLAFPDQANRYLPVLLPGIAPTAPASTVQSFEADLEVTIPADADASAIRAAFVAAYMEAAQERFGPQAQINPNALSYVGGQPELVETLPDGQAIYRVSMQGFVGSQ